jgi:hypothetical protein
MKHVREFDTSYFPNPIVQGVNYSLFIRLIKGMVSMELKGALGSSFGSVSLPILAVCRSVWCISCFSAALIAKSPKGSFI